MVKNAQIIPLAIKKTTGTTERATLTVRLPPDLADKICHEAVMLGKDPTAFMIEWLKSGFPRDLEK